MQEESNPVKDYLFDYIENSQIIPELISQKKFDVIIEDITKNCYWFWFSVEKCVQG